MIVGIGMDIVEKERITPLNKLLVNKVLSLEEYKIYKTLELEERKVEFFGGRFAAKEAFFKALGIGISDISFAAVSILPNEFGQPQIVTDYLSQRDVSASVTITHSENIIAAAVVLEEREGK